MGFTVVRSGSWWSLLGSSEFLLDSRDGDTWGQRVGCVFLGLSVLCRFLFILNNACSCSACLLWRSVLCQ